MSSRGAGRILALLIVWSPASVLAATAAQQRCLDALGRQGAHVAAAAGSAAVACARTVTAPSDHAPNQPPRAGAARACLTTRIDEQLAGRSRRLAHADARWCRERPDAGYLGAAAVAAAARAAGIGVVEDVLGTDLTRARDDRSRRHALPARGRDRRSAAACGLVDR